MMYEILVAAIFTIAGVAVALAVALFITILWMLYNMVMEAKERARRLIEVRCTYFDDVGRGPYNV
jgi:hypothetical protein